MAKKKKHSAKQEEQRIENLARHLTRRGPGNEEHAPTTQRLSRAAEAGNSVEARVIHNDRGFPTADFRWEITPVLDLLESRGTLTADEYAVALRYMRHYAGSRHKGPA